MNYRIIALVLVAMALSPKAPAASPVEDQGIRLGIFHVSPSVRLLGAYDKEKGADGDYFGETEVGAKFENSEARYDVGGSVAYGYRAYDTYSALDGDFYGISGMVASQESPLKLSLNGQQIKTVDYDVRVEDGAGSNLGAVLTRSSSTRSSVRVAADYEKPVTGNTALAPGYEGWYYRQTFEGFDDAEWQEHKALLRYGYNLESLMVLFVSGSYAVQYSDLENGSVANFSVGAESRTQEKTSWKALIGVSAADYEQSGTDVGVEASVNARWQVTDKVSAYLFGGTSYQPGYVGYGSGGARQVYRVGYGGEWAILDRLRLSAQLLHDRQEEIQSGLVINRDFANAQLQYEIARIITVALGGGYTKDDVDSDRMVVSCSATLRY